MTERDVMNAGVVRRLSVHEPRRRPSIQFSRRIERIRVGKATVR
jgi:hypothetical protein